MDVIYESNPQANDVVKQEAPARKRGRPLGSFTSTGQPKQRMDYNVPRFVKEPPYEDAYSSFEDEDDALEDEEGQGSENRRRSKKTLPTYSKAGVRNLFFGQHQQCPALERVLFRFQGRLISAIMNYMPIHILWKPVEVAILLDEP